jgi:polyisoprenoid-binding protein YceI
MAVNNGTIMKAKNSILILLVAGLLFAPYLIQAQAAYKGKQNKMSVVGSSTLHEWESEVTQVESKGSFTLENNKLTSIKDVTVKIVVTSIKSTKGKTMDNKTYEAFNSDKNPNITYKLTSAKITGSGPECTVAANGSLTMAGTTKPIDMTAKGKVLANGDVQITGTHKLNMKDFNMVPPTAMMGTIKVGEEVEVKFDIIFTPDK